MAYLTPARNRTSRQASIRRSTAANQDLFSLMLANIRAVFEQAEDEHESYAEGLAWYRVAHVFALELSQTYDITLEQAAGVIAVLSPSTNWSRNIALADELLSTGDCSHAYGECITKAKRILQGETLDDVVKIGRKVRNFYQCIMNPDTLGHVCIDRHAVVLATGLPIQQLDGWLDLSATYQLTAAAYRTIAREVGLLPNQVQAITWCQHRRNTDTYKGDF